MLRKLWLVSLYWVLQGLVVWVAVAYLAASIEGVDRDTGVLWGRVTATDLQRALVDNDLVLAVLVAGAGIAAVQAVFLWPVRRPTRKEASGPSVFLSMAAAGLVLATMAGAAVAAALQFLMNYASFGDALNEPAALAVVATFLLSWVLGTLFLVMFCLRGPRESVLSRLASRLLLGTIVEVAAIIPLDVLVRKRESCYCLAGTYWALLACGAAGLVVLGPAVLLPVLIRRRRRWYGARCESCGYDLTHLGHVDRCPECGVGWKAPASGGA